jgi:hypothetical protein
MLVMSSLPSSSLSTLGQVLKSTKAIMDQVLVNPIMSAGAENNIFGYYLALAGLEAHLVCFFSFLFGSLILLLHSNY